jgi:hypothetical protein
MNQHLREENQLAVVQQVHLVPLPSQNLSQKKTITAKMKATALTKKELNGGKMMLELGGIANKAKAIGPNGKTENQVT